MAYKEASKQIPKSKNYKRYKTKVAEGSIYLGRDEGRKYKFIPLSAIYSCICRM